MDRDSLSEIINASKQGKRLAQQQLYNTFSGKMYALCLYYSKNKDDAEDLLHNGFIKVFQKIGQFKGDGPFEAWIRKIFMNTALEAFRKKNKPVSLNDEIEYSNFNIEADVLGQLSSNEIIQLIQELSPAYRMTFNLYAIEGYSHKEISEMLGISEGTSKSNLSRARYILQKKVTDQYKSADRKIK